MGWSGCQPIQFPIRGMKYSTVMQVPSSKDGRLLKMLAKAEPRVAKICGYQVKFVERSGKQLSKLFPRDLGATDCFRMDCAVCQSNTGKGSALCQVKSVVYTGTCRLCNDKHKSNPTAPHKGIYVGQTSRTLYERLNEHQKSLKRYENSSFMFKHWASAHPELITAPEFDFKVVRKHKDPLSRLVHEAVKINLSGIATELLD